MSDALHKQIDVTIKNSKQTVSLGYFLYRGIACFYFQLSCRLELELIKRKFNFEGLMRRVQYYIVV